MEENIIEKVRKENDIASVIGSYLPLIKKGKNYFCVCPFHDDTNPSMSISSEKGIYKCFSCGASGNVYNFIMDYEKVSFKEALNILAKRVNITLSGNYTKKDIKQNQDIYDAYDFALRFYQNNINAKDGVDAKKYLYQRNINDDTIKHFKIGLSLSTQDELTKILIAKKYNINVLNEIGLSYQNKDLYINRIMFPLFDLNGEIVGFSGRIYNSKSDSKYVNTKETKIFKKGELLYNYHFAKEEIRKSKYLILVEGFMDVIRLYLSGIYNVVALMGTSLTKEQVNLLKKLSSNIYLSLDGDEPGQKAIANIGETLLKNDFKVNVIPLNNNLDPDEYIIKNGVKSYLGLIDNALSFSDFKINYLKKGKNFNSIEEKTEYINKVLEEISLEKDEIKTELLLDKVSKEFEIDKQLLKKKLQKPRKYDKITSFVRKEIKTDKYTKAAYTILYNMIINNNLIDIYQEKLNFLPHQEERYLASEIIYLYHKNQEVNEAMLYTELYDKKELLELYKKIINENIIEVKEVSQIFDYFKVIEDYIKNQEIKRLKEKIEEEPSTLEKAKLLEEIRLIKMGS